MRPGDKQVGKSCQGFYCGNEQSPDSKVSTSHLQVQLQVCGCAFIMFQSIDQQEEFRCRLILLLILIIVDLIISCTERKTVFIFIDQMFTYLF